VSPGEADAILRSLVDNWTGLHAEAVRELAAATEPDDDPQVESTKHAHGLAAAAEIKLGKIVAEAAHQRDVAQRAAERQRARWL
jgi:hypothetical protein